MAARRFKFLIESILGGESPSSLEFSPGQFQSSFGIDPDLPLESNFAFQYWSLNESVNKRASGVLAPVKVYSMLTTTAGAPQWILPTPRPQLSADEKYVYDSVGSVYTLTTSGVNSVVGIGDLNDGGSAAANGIEYYDNYVYFARASTVARYGPMNGTPAFVDDYWITTLSKAPLTNTVYPAGQYSTASMPNHVMKRHNNGKLYFADVVGNQGVLHCISTTKTTVEGDTDNGSTFNAIDFPYGYWPTSIESYGDQIVVALYDGNPASNNQNGIRAKIAFWDPTNPTTYSQLIDFEFPDPLITRIINIDGALYFYSGTAMESPGLRVSQYIGGSSFKQLQYFPDVYLPAPGAISNDFERIYFGGKYKPATDLNNTETSLDGRAVVQAFGSRTFGGMNLYSVMGTADSTAAAITSVLFDQGRLYCGYASFGGTFHGGLSERGNSTSADSMRYQTNLFRSETFKVGEPFKITKIRIPLAQTLASVSGLSTSKQIQPYVWVDSGSFISTLQTVNATNYPDAVTRRDVVIRPTALTGSNDFFLEFEWDTDEPLTVKLPITIEGEYLED